MSVIEVDLIRFTGGPRRGECAIMVDYKSLIEIFDLDGGEIIKWDGSEFQLDPSEWTEETHFVDQWIHSNPYTFVYPPDLHMKLRVLKFANSFRSLKPVEVFTYSRQSFGYRAHVCGLMSILFGTIAILLVPRKHDDW